MINCHIKVPNKISFRCAFYVFAFNTILFQFINKPVKR